MARGLLFRSPNYRKKKKNLRHARRSKKEKKIVNFRKQKRYENHNTEYIFNLRKLEHSYKQVTLMNKA